MRYVVPGDISALIAEFLEENKRDADGNKWGAPEVLRLLLGNPGKCPECVKQLGRKMADSIDAGGTHRKPGPKPRPKTKLVISSFSELFENCGEPEVIS